MSNRGNEDLLERLREIAVMDRAACVDAISAMPGIAMPPRLRAETLRRLLAYEEQARLVGRLSAQERRALRSIATGRSSSNAGTASARPGSRPRSSTAGGRTYRVEVTDAGFVLDGTTYRSLSAVAKRITGTAWSGPRFFGLTAKRSA